MKQIFGAIAILSILVLSGCKGKSQNESVAENNESKVAAATVTQMNTQMFIDKVMDYKANPQQWVFKGDKPCIIDFYADWCKPCKMVAPIMEELAGEYSGKINIYKVNTDQEQELAGIFGIQSIPAILYCPKDGKPQMFTGAYPKEEYVKLINQVLLNTMVNDSVK